MGDSIFSLEMNVRDYECDMQGLVNNAVYQNYLEWARHEFLLSRGLSFADLTARGVIIVVTRAELDYRQSLRTGDSFVVTVRAVQASRIRMEFQQVICKQPNGELMLEAKITATAVNERNRPYFPEELKALF
ncbi:MAG: acyl-CoA thioesterase [Proteobacteria bacterium]|nr:acyl-CoA thioesterase [Pseudomonadota bacterium]